MQKQKVGSRIGLFVFAIAGLVLTAMVAEGKAGLRPSVALASENGVAVASILPSAPARVSPFFASPALDAMLREVAMETAGRSRILDPEEMDLECSASLVYVQHNYVSEWYIDTTAIWSCIVSGLIGIEAYQVNWNWALIEGDGITPLITCGTVWGAWYNGGGGGCSYADYENLYEYECEGDEQFAFNYQVLKYGHEYTWTGPVIEYNVPVYGCDS